MNWEETRKRFSEPKEREAEMCICSHSKYHHSYDDELEQFVSCLKCAECRGYALWDFNPYKDPAVQSVLKEDFATLLHEAIASKEEQQAFLDNEGLESVPLGL